MDEMSMVRRLLAEPPPAAHVVAEGRARIFGSRVRSSRVRVIRRGGVRRALGLGLSGAAVVLAVAMLVPKVGTTPGNAPPPTTDWSARNVLLAAADRAELSPTSGDYWHVRSMSRTTLRRELGPDGDRYTVELLSIVENWTDRSGRTWWGNREWARPKSPQDEAAWERDGSPSKWCMGHTDTEPPEPNCLHTAPGVASVTRMDRDTFSVVEGRELTFAELQRLPEEPDALRAWVVDAVKDDLDPSASADILDFNVAEVLANILVDVPVPPGVRAAAYRALADMPTVTSIGPIQDEIGRSGVGILIDGPDRAAMLLPGGQTFGPGQLTRRLIIDPQTSHVLANQASLGSNPDPVSGTLILEVGWTNDSPHEPAMP